MIHYVIPARKGSKGLPLKNRMLFKHTLDMIPESEYDNVILSTDDELIGEMGYMLNVHFRKPVLSDDYASMKDVLLNIIDEMKIQDGDVVVLLYLTYPQRTWGEVQRALEIFKQSESSSFLCKKDVQTHPYLCIYGTGEQVVEHDLYRRQDYPRCYEISHYIAISYAGEVKNLKKNLYDDGTYFYHIDNVIDVDTPEDLNEFKSQD